MKDHSCCCRLLGSWGSKTKSCSSGQGPKGVYGEQVGCSGNWGTTHTCPACQSTVKKRNIKRDPIKEHVITHFGPTVTLQGKLYLLCIGFITGDPSHDDLT